MHHDATLNPEPLLTFAVFRDEPAALHLDLPLTRTSFETRAPNVFKAWGSFLEGAKYEQVNLPM